MKQHRRRHRRIALMTPFAMQRGAANRVTARLLDEKPEPLPDPFHWYPRANYFVRPQRAVLLNNIT